MNRIIVEGNLVAAASVTTGKNDRDVLSFTVACNMGKTAAGEAIVEYVPVVAFGKKGFADNLKDYLGKGAGVSSIGRLVQTKNEKDGTVYTNARCEVSALRNIRLVGGQSTPAADAGSKTDSVENNAAAENALEAQAAAAGSAAASNLPVLDDADIPF